MADLIRIDGSYGEGGGQILRTALALSAITGRPLELFDIRKGRTTPGLGNQHLASVRALAQIAQAQVEGDRLGSDRLRLTPTTVRTGTFSCDVAEERGSAGSVTLVLQACLPPLCLAPNPSQLVLRGGTHVPWSPPVHYVQAVLLPMLEPLGIRASLELVRAGWYPAGGGEIRVTMQPASRLISQTWNSRGTLRHITGWSIVSNLPNDVAQRQQRAVCDALRAQHLDAVIECVALPSPGTGTCVVLVAEFESTRAGFAALGKPGKPAEQVGREAARALLEFLNTDAALEEHLADQVAIFLALAQGPSAFTTAKITRHLLTNLWTIQQCLPVQVTIEGEEGKPGGVAIQPMA